MRTKYFYISFLTVLAFSMLVQSSFAQVSREQLEELNQKIEKQNQEIQILRNQLASETSNLKQQIDDYAPLALLLFLFGGFCALWAQNTGRNPWMWFFTGLIFSLFAVITVLIRNAENNDERD